MSGIHSHVPYGPEGRSSYSEHSSWSFKVIERTKPVVMEALDMIESLDGPFTLVDYGTADGGVSMGLIEDIVGKIRGKFGGDQQVQIIYEDQPVNDFKSLFKRVHGLDPGTPTYYQKYDGVFVLACGTTFYSQCLPTNSVHFGVSTSAFHWLSQSPCHLDGQVCHLICDNEAKKKLFAEQAAKDWEQILLKRATELKPGGQFVATVFAVDHDGHFSDTVPGVVESFYSHIARCWSEMYEEGCITKAEYEMGLLCAYFRRLSEIEAPFKDASPVHKAGLRLKSSEIQRVRCPLHMHWLQHGNKDDANAARRYAEEYVASMRMWTNYSFIYALNNSRSADEKTALVDKLYAKYENIVASAPEKHGSDLVHAYIHVQKIKATDAPLQTA